MGLTRKIINISRWDSYAIIIILFAVVIQLLKWRIFPISIDIYYHLLTAVGFNEAGGWVGHCFWEFAPVGRPQVYPPLLHIIILFLIKAGVPILTIGKLIQFAVYPLLIFVIWYVIKEIFNSKQAFLTILMIFSIYSFYLVAVNACAASLALIFCLLSLLFFDKNKILGSSSLLAVSFYTHTFTSWIFLSALLAYGLFDKKNLKSCLKISFLALLLASPFIFYQVVMKDYYIFQRSIVENYHLKLNIFHWLFFLFGIISCLKRGGRYYIFVALFLSSLILLPMGFIFRYFSFYGIIGLVFMNTVFLSAIYDNLRKTSKKVCFFTIFILFFIFSPTLTIDSLERNSIDENIIPHHIAKNLGSKRVLLNLNMIDSSLINFILYKSFYVMDNEGGIYYPKFFNNIVEVILNNSENKDIIYVNFPYTAGILSLLSGRVISTAMLSEVAPYRDFDKIAASRLIVWQKNPDDIEKEPVNLIEKYGLKKIADTDLAFIYENQKCSYKKQALPAVINYKMLFLLVSLVFTLILRSLKFNIDKY